MWQANELLERLVKLLVKNDAGFHEARVFNDEWFYELRQVDDELEELILEIKDYLGED